ncbi:unnamed protein product [Phaedon cochleariae]|uniref:U2A'/phosphoprotein 32 family A C-terminal domain-containing protein n=1 Tax=Phaedon cochleariae TaxID=80249 RepID=A0A9P0DUE9_PHACE|nr:unnamed protein product [Phaedon cochleariae]
MVRITEELVRKRSEHNEGIIGTLEELSLHQEDIEKIEHLNNWCKDLQILYLQANLIPKIENLNKLKKLEYLNLAINNIEVIENLERCESLTKLDLTLNFIGNLESVRSLRNNIHLRDVYLTGNPCCDFEGYRDYVIAQLPQIQNLDMKEISRTERIKAQQNFPTIEKRVQQCQAKYRMFRMEQQQRMSNKDTTCISDEEFWNTSSENCPESRVEMANRQRKSKKSNENKEISNTERSARLFSKDGKPLNINQAKIDFKFNDDDPKQFVLDIAVYKFMDSNLIQIDLQPIYVKILIKGKIFQIVFPEEICTNKSIAQRSQTTGHLVLKLPKANYDHIVEKYNSQSFKQKHKSEMINHELEKKHEYLEVEHKEDMDFSKIVENQNRVRNLYDDPEVPPLEYF